MKYEMKISGYETITFKELRDFVTKVANEREVRPETLSLEFDPYENEY